MRKPLAVLLAASLLLSACSGWRDSRINPGNWFSGSRPVPVEGVDSGELANPLIPQKRASMLARAAPADNSVPITTITALRVERNTTGITVLATGVATRQGGYATSLRPVPPAEDDPKGVLTLSFRVNYPVYPTPVGPERTRTINEAHFISNKDLADIRLIRVEGANNAREVRRR